MQSGPCNRVLAWLRPVRSWPLWEQPRRLIGLIALVTSGYLAAVVLAASTVHVRPRDLLLFGALLACIAATVELTKRSGENAGVIKDVYAVWELPIAILLPPVYALLAPVLQYTLTQWRIRRVVLHKRIFSTAAIGLSYGLASALFHQAVQAQPASVSVFTAACRGGWWPWPWRACCSGRRTRPWCSRRSRLRTPPCASGTCCWPGKECRTTWLSCVLLSWSLSASPSALSRFSSRSRSSPCCSARCGMLSWSTRLVSIPRRACSTPEPGNARRRPRSPALSVHVPRWRWC